MEPTAVEVHSILFRPDDTIEITYAEPEELTPDVSVVRTILLKRERFEGAIRELEFLGRALIDEGLVAVRQPPETRPASRR